MLVDRRKAIQLVSGTVGASLVASATVLPTVSKHAAAAPAAAQLFPEKGRFAIPMKPSFRFARDTESEIAVCHGELVIEVSNSGRSQSGARELTARVVSWSATGKASLAGGAFEVRNVKSEDASQNVIAALGKSDFPAKLRVLIPYELVAPYGTAHGVKVMEGTISSLPASPADLLRLEDAVAANWKAAAGHSVAALRIDSLVTVCV